MNAHQLIDLGKITQQDGNLFKLDINRLDKIMKTVNDGNKIADDINLELDR